MTKHDKEKIEQIENAYVDEKISIGRVNALLWMARYNVVPDGTFGDSECCLWQKFRDLIRNSR